MSVTEATATARWKEQSRQEWSAGAAAWRKWHGPFAAMTRAAAEALVVASGVR